MDPKSECTAGCSQGVQVLSNEVLKKSQLHNIHGTKGSPLPIHEWLIFMENLKVNIPYMDAMGKKTWNHTLSNTKFFRERHRKSR